LEITFTSWRIDDVAEMDRINALYTLKHPDVTIRFDSYDPMICDSINTNPRPGMNLLLPVKKSIAEGKQPSYRGLTTSGYSAGLFSASWESVFMEVKRPGKR